MGAAASPRLCPDPPPGFCRLGLQDLAGRPTVSGTYMHTSTHISIQAAADTCKHIHTPHKHTDMLTPHFHTHIYRHVHTETHMLVQMHKAHRNMCVRIPAHKHTDT